MQRLIFAKFGWVLLDDLPLQKLAKKQHTEFTEGAYQCPILAVCRPRFLKFRRTVGPFVVSKIPMPFPVVGFFPKMYAMKSRSRRKNDQKCSFWSPVPREERPSTSTLKCCVRNFSNLVYCKVISRCGHRGFGLRSSTPSTSTSSSSLLQERTGITS